MSKWSIIFLIIPIVGVGLFAVADQYGWSLPENVSTAGVEIDFLYYFILVITGITFIGTNAALVWILVKFGDNNNGRRATYTHGSRTLEIIWTVIPAAILGLIAIAQMPAWVRNKFPSHQPNVAPTARVIARQFEWRIVYPGKDGKIGTIDDVHVPNELHMVKERKTLIELTSMDVLHSFFLPHMRVKQDAVPGLRIPVWFDANKSTLQFQDDGCLLTANDFYYDPDGIGDLALALKEAKTPAAKLVKGKLKTDVAGSIDKYDGKDPLPADVAASLIENLNEIIKGPSLYDPAVFPDAKLDKETKTHLQLAAGARYPKLLNRQLLQDSFPEEIVRLARHYELVCAELCGWGHYKMKGRVFVHDTQEEFDAWLAAATASQEASR